jgi:hypothetical protein
LNKKTGKDHSDKKLLQEAIDRLQGVNEFVESELDRHKQLQRLGRIEEELDWAAGFAS